MAVFLAPLGFNAYDFVQNGLDEEDLGTDQDVVSFTSLTDSVIFILRSNQSIITDEIRNFTADFAFNLQNNPITQQYGADGTPIEHIFSLMQQVLTPYYVSLYSIVGLFNVSSFVLIEGINDFLQNWIQYEDNNTTNALEAAMNDTQVLLDTKLQELAFGVIVFDLVDIILTSLDNTVNGTSSQDWNFNSLIQVISQSDTILTADLNNDIREGLDFLFTAVNETSAWDETFVYPMVSTFLFGKSDMEGQTFLSNLYDNANDPTRAVKLAEENLIPFVSGVFVPYGFPEEIRSFYLQALTNSDGSAPASSIVIRFKIRQGIGTDEINRLFEEMDRIANEVQETNTLGLDIAILSILNYQRERSLTYTNEMHRVDIIAVVAAFIILMIFLKNLYFSVLGTAVSFLSTQIVRAFLILGQPITGNWNATSFSMAVTMLLGASLNYTVFFGYRYMESRNRKLNHEEAVKLSIGTALHSVVISGIAVLLVTLPYIISSVGVLSGFSKAVVIGMALQVVVLFVTIPISFLVSESIINRWKVPQITTGRRKYAINFNKKNVRRILQITLIAAVISTLFILALPSSFSSNDFIGDEGQTGFAKQILEDDYPKNYLSKVLIKVNLNYSVIDQASRINNTALNLVDELSGLVEGIPSVLSILSPAWPLGSSFNFSDTAVGLVTSESAEIVARQLISNEGYQAYIIAQLEESYTNPELNDQTAELVSLVRDFQNQWSEQLTVEMSGLPIETLFLTNDVLSELPIQVIAALVMLTLFLWWRLQSVIVPIRLQLSILIADLYAIALSSGIYMLLFGRALNLLTITLSILILLGLGTDFDIYIYRRIQEEMRTNSKSLKDSIDVALEKSAPAIRTSGLVMAFSLFSLFSSEIDVIRQFGLVSFIAILIDIFLVRIIIVPALLLYGSKERLE